ncbi:hypothetical protein E4U30_000052 [Claviceps sp. LM220 group G6]|nr:hypothetical protein E4U30_000052 [Claviceps sp. LM220 group G6]
MSVDIATPEAESTTGGLTRDASLQCGKIFILVERGSGKALMAVGQNAVLQACHDMRALQSMWQWHWHCTVRNGWVTLRNRITENYLGADFSSRSPRGTYFALKVAPCAGAFTGYLVVTRSSGGGQTLSAPYKEDIRQIVRRKESQALGLGTYGMTEGIEWEFIRVEP